jgi:hypothetical protein
MLGPVRPTYRPRAQLNICAPWLPLHGLRIVLTRCFSFIGPGLPLNAQFPMGNFSRDPLSDTAINPETFHTCAPFSTRGTWPLAFSA